MKIVQITDIHIDKENESPFKIDVRKNFLKVLRALKSVEPAHLIVSGDLCYNFGEKEIYAWIKKQLDRSKIPYSVISGNHDDTLMMAEIFELEHLLDEQELYYAKRLGKTICLFLDSSKGSHSENQLKWLKRQMKSAKEDLVIFMHHPPFKSGVPFMDNKHSLKDMEAVQKLLFSYPYNITIYCGHYHVEKTIRSQNVLMQITPSCFFQIDQNEPEFKVDHHMIAYRLIDIENQQISSSVKYFSGYKGT